MAVTYTFHRRGSTTGAQTGRRRSWKAGDSLVAPRGEFHHLRDDMYTARVIQPDPSPQIEASASQQQRYRVEQNEGWTKVIDTETGDKVGNSIRGAGSDAREEAAARIESLLSNE